MTSLQDTTLVKLGYGKIDKLCDAGFIRKIFKSTKKDFALFVSNSTEMQTFLEGLEEKIEETNGEYREMIQEYLESIPDEVNKFRTKLKELQRLKKLNQMEIQKKLLREEILKEMEAENKKKEIQEKLGIKPTTNQSSTEESVEETEKSDTTNQMTFKSRPPKTFCQNSMDLGEFYAFLKVVIKNDWIIIKSDQGRMKVRDLDLDDDKIRIKVEQL